ncbi:MAG: glycosyltransferase family 4 protein [Leptolyngbya sp. SIO3F4]|nr:glycosyltransferase family 4 protein [Leptolyngbya sp. SIO3F4]
MGFQATYLARIFLGAKVVFNLRDIDVKKPVKKRWVDYVKHSYRTVLLSFEMMNHLAANAADSSKMKVIYSIVDFNVFRKYPIEPKDTQTGKYNVLYVASFNDKKNQKQFIDQCLAKLSEHNMHVHFIGDDENEYAQDCKKQIAALGLENATFHGFVEDMSYWYNFAELTLVPTRNEGLARCMIESISCGTPVVSFDVCSAVEILSKYNCGKVVEQGDYVSFVNEMVALAEDAASLEALGGNGIKCSRELFDVRRISREYIRLYNSES